MEGTDSRRSPGDRWDLASSVGATATVAAARALATREAEPLIDDPFAEPLVRAVGIDFFTACSTVRSALPPPTKIRSSTWRG
jgi:O-methyltransferase involved in polyketide biosynthesis